MSSFRVPTRRFGRTELQMPVFSCGGMRYQQAWKELDPETVEREQQENLERTIYRAFELGINHIETARGYGSSEMQLGWVLPRLPREQLIVQTKINPGADPQEFLEKFEKSYKHLQLEHVDLLAFHGINTLDNLNDVVLRNGCMKIARQLQKEGRVRFVGFSTHGPTDVITQANATGEFDYFNVHWYYVNGQNWPAIEEATRQDMGVFIISPTDKGGMLQKPSDKMKELCAPLHPMQFNDLWCLARPQVHTLSIGASRPSDFDAHVEALEHYDHIEATIAPIEERLSEAIAHDFGDEWQSRWMEGLPTTNETWKKLNVREILRLYTYAKSLDLVEWAKGRYNLMKADNPWVPGDNLKATEEEDWAHLQQQIKGSPFAAQIPGYLRAAHELLTDEEKKRLSESAS